jgi:hypothetical protein
MSIDSLISALLFEAEGAELDFKREQYRFSGADDREKSELLKDVLAFANAWRRTDAYILIGVQEVKEAEAEVIGITEHIDDARLQQFVNSKTNRPVEFSYTPTSFQGKQIGVIHIPVQDRPIFLTKDYGSLRRNTVYLRRGSSTDEARPDEIARMGHAASEGLRPRPLLIPQLAMNSDWSNLVEGATFETVQLIHPEIKNLPDYSRSESSGPFGMPIYSSFRHTNSDFYRERAEYLRFGAKLRPIRFCIRNEGTAPASDVKLITHIADPTHDLEFSLGSDRPKAPRREWSPIDNIRPISMNQAPPDIEITKTSAGWTISAYFGKIQAKDTRLTSEQLFVGMTQSGSTKLSVSVFADELSSPMSSTLSISFVVTEQELTYDKLTS